MRRAKSRKKKTMIPKVVFGAVAVVVLSFTAFGPFACFRHPNVTYVQAGTVEDRLKYKVVEIEAGDSLWSIASENMSEEYDDVNDYIKAIKKCNSLNSDRINEGAYLMIPYYED